MDFLAEAGCHVSFFPCNYLGLPFNIRKASRVSFQPLVQKVGDRLPDWQRRLLSYPSRKLLVRSVLSSIPTHYMTVFKLPKWAASGIDKFRRSFLWTGKDPSGFSGGHCHASRKTCVRPKRWGGGGAWPLKILRSLIEP
jgi:hypothetical protein